MGKEVRRTPASQSQAGYTGAKTNERLVKYAIPQTGNSLLMAPESFFVLAIVNSFSR